jgi:restriction system protein
LYTHRQEVIAWLFIIAGVLIIGAIAYAFLKKFKKAATLGWDDDKILYMLKGMSPAQFESEIAKLFEALGYATDVVGGANDGGIDVVARKDGKKYFIQCKKFITKEATPHDVRDFLGAITNINNPAERGFFVTTNKFTVMAEKTAEGNPRIELIDGIKLVQYYRLAYGKSAPESEHVKSLDSKTSQLIKTEASQTCPRCGGFLALKAAHKGEHAGQQFWGCSNFPKCRYLQNAEAAVAVR